MTDCNQARKQSLLNSITMLFNTLEEAKDLRIEGRLTRMVGLTLEAVGCRSPLGSQCRIITAYHKMIHAEVVGFSGEKTYLMAITHPQGITPGARVLPSEHKATIPVGHSLLGRVLDGSGAPLDNGPPIIEDLHYPIQPEPINPLQRALIKDPLDVGIQAINALLTIGRGQRIGLFAGSGVGKSVLLGMMTRLTAADIVVVGLIGERGREVKEFIEMNLGGSGLNNSVIVACPADTSPLMRIHGAMHATAIAEYFRDQGKHVLLLMDSLTRFAQAHREIGLAIGEPPTSKGYTPSVFSSLAQLVERTGNSIDGGGSITAFYTVLAEGDDQQDPVVDAARAILDGHIILSRELADRGHYPAIDIEGSVSRVMPNVTTTSHQQMIKTFRKFYSKYQQNKDLISVGAYVRGSDPEIDLAIEFMPKLLAFLQQDTDEAHVIEASIQELHALMKQIVVNKHEEIRSHQAIGPAGLSGAKGQGTSTIRQSA